MNTLRLVECPRDAMQGWPTFIPTALKTDYLNTLLRVGFDTLDFGSFVSPKAIPQLADTAAVLKGLHLGDTKTKLLAIVANERGAEQAVMYDEISFLGFPFSISETFQRLNTNSSITDSFRTVERMQDLCVRRHKQLVVYISMGFGNPYGDDYDPSIVASWIEKLAGLGIGILSLADTVGVSTPEQIKEVFAVLAPAFPHLEIGAHLHATPETASEKVMAALETGCRRIDSALNGIGGCPMAQNELVGNVATETVLTCLQRQQINPLLNEEALAQALQLAPMVFTHHG